MAVGLALSGCAILLCNCAVVGAVSAVAARDNYKKCTAEVKATTAR
jgi:hypothetical protein